MNPQLLELARTAHAPEWEARGRIWRCTALLQLGDVVAVDADIEQLAVLERAAPVPSLRFRVACLQATRALMSGDYDHGYELALRENERLRHDIERLQGSIRQYQELENGLKSTLVHAQKVADDVRINAAAEADRLVKEAQGRADRPGAAH